MQGNGKEGSGKTFPEISNRKWVQRSAGKIIGIKYTRRLRVVNTRRFECRAVQVAISTGKTVREKAKQPKGGTIRAQH